MESIENQDNIGFYWETFTDSCPPNAVYASPRYAVAKGYLDKAKSYILGKIDNEEKIGLFPFSNVDHPATEKVEILCLQEGYTAKWIQYICKDSIPNSTVGPIEYCFVARVKNSNGVYIPAKYHIGGSVYWGDKGHEECGSDQVKICEILIIEKIEIIENIEIIEKENKNVARIEENELIEAQLINIEYEFDNLKIAEENSKVAGRVVFTNHSSEKQEVKHKNKYSIIGSKNWDIGNEIPFGVSLKILGAPKIIHTRGLGVDKKEYFTNYGAELQTCESHEYDGHTSVPAMRRLILKMTYEEIKIDVHFQATLIKNYKKSSESVSVKGVYTEVQGSNIDGFNFIENKLSDSEERKTLAYHQNDSIWPL